MWGGRRWGGGVQAQSVTETERFHEQGTEREGDAGREAESAIPADRREEGREEGGRGRERSKESGRKGEKMMEPRNRLGRTAAFHPRSVRQT